MSRISSFFAGVALTAAIVLPFTSSALQQDPQSAPSPEEIEKMMQKAQQFTSPGPRHQALEKLIGDWDSTRPPTLISERARYTICSGLKGSSTWSTQGRRSRPWLGTSSTLAGSWCLPKAHPFRAR